MSEYFVLDCDIDIQICDEFLPVQRGKHELSPATQPELVHKGNRTCPQFRSNHTYARSPPTILPSSIRETDTITNFLAVGETS